MALMTMTPMLMPVLVQAMHSVAVKKRSRPRKRPRSDGCSPIATLASVLVRYNGGVEGRVTLASVLVRYNAGVERCAGKRISKGILEVEDYFTSGLVRSTPGVSYECVAECHSTGTDVQ
jgi:hypothetical protein